MDRISIAFLFFFFFLGGGGGGLLVVFCFVLFLTKLIEITNSTLHAERKDVDQSKV